MITRRGAFSAGQMQIAINNGKAAKRRLDALDYEDGREKAVLEHEVRMGERFEKLLREHMEEKP